MKRIYSITFSLCLGFLFLGMPHVYGSRYSDRYEDPDFALFAHAMNLRSEYSLIDSSVETYIAQEKVLSTIEKKTRMFPTKYSIVASGYLRTLCIQSNPTFGFNYMFPIVLNYILEEDKDQYNQRVKKILGWAVTYNRYDFITSHLEEVYKNQFCYEYNDFENIKEILLNKSQLSVYLYKNNYLKRNFLIWLVQQLKFALPTIEQMKNPDQIIEYRSSWKDKMGRLCRLRAYKLEVINALIIKKDIGLYDLLCSHLLTEQMERQNAPYSLVEITKKQNAIFGQLSDKDKKLALLSNFYWRKLDEDRKLVLDSNFYWRKLNSNLYTAGGDVRGDLSKVDTLLDRRTVYDKLYPGNEYNTIDTPSSKELIKIYTTYNSSQNLNEFTTPVLLSKIKNEILLTPAIYSLVVKRVLYKEFITNSSIYSYKNIVDIISSFLADLNNYMKKTKSILACAKNSQNFGFITEYLLEMSAYSNYYDNSHFNFIKKTLNFDSNSIFLYKENFFKKKFLLFLLKRCRFELFEVKQTPPRFPHFSNYKKDVILLLKNGQELQYDLYCGYILFTMHKVGILTSVKFSKLRSKIITQSSSPSKSVSFLSNLAKDKKNTNIVTTIINSYLPPLSQKTAPPIYDKKYHLGHNLKNTKPSIVKRNSILLLLGLIMVGLVKKLYRKHPSSALQSPPSSSIEEEINYDKNKPQALKNDIGQLDSQDSSKDQMPPTPTPKDYTLLILLLILLAMLVGTGLWLKKRK